MGWMSGDRGDPSVPTDVPPTPPREKTADPRTRPSDPPTSKRLPPPLWAKGLFAYGLTVIAWLLYLPYHGQLTLKVPIGTSLVDKTYYLERRAWIWQTLDPRYQVNVSQAVTEGLLLSLVVGVIVLSWWMWTREDHA